MKQRKLACTASRPENLPETENMSRKFNYAIDLISNHSIVAIHAHLKEIASEGTFQEDCLVTRTFYFTNKQKKRLKGAAVIKNVYDILNAFWKPPE